MRITSVCVCAAQRIACAELVRSEGAPAVLAPPHFAAHLTLSPPRRVTSKIRKAHTTTTKVRGKEHGHQGPYTLQEEEVTQQERKVETSAGAAKDVW